MNFELLHDFLGVSDTMNLTLSAEERNTTQSNLSKRIRQLETWLGRDLIDRHSRPLTLTQAGHDFIPIARNVIAQLDEYRDAHVPWSVAEGAVSIAMPHSATISVFPNFKQRIVTQIQEPASRHDWPIMTRWPLCLLVPSAIWPWWHIIPRHRRLRSLPFSGPLKLHGNDW